MTRHSHPLTQFRARSATSSIVRSAETALQLDAVPPASVGSIAHQEATGLSMEIRRNAPRPVVAVSGELDLAGTELLEALVAHVRATDPGVVAVDLDRVTFIDTHGLAPVLEPDVVLVAASPAVRRLLRLLGLPEPRPGLSRRRAPRGRRQGRPARDR